MPLTRKKVRDAARAILADEISGINVRMVDISEEYGVGAVQIDWANWSTNLYQGFVNAAQLDLSQIEQWPALNIYTSDLVNENRQKPRTFSGTITLHVDVWIKVKSGTGAEHDDIESIADAIEDGVISCLYDDAAAWPPGVTPAAEYSVPKEPAELLGDGWTQRIPIIIPCEVDA